MSIQALEYSELKGHFKGKKIHIRSTNILFKNFKTNGKF